MSESVAHGVYILEDNLRTSRQLQAAVQGDHRLRLVGSASCLSDALQWLAGGGQADAALVDIGLPDGSGIDFIQSLNSQTQAAKPLVMTVFGDEKSVVNAIAAGAMGYLLKERDGQHIADSICDVLAGGSPVSPSIARHLLRRFQEPSKNTSDIHLTEREEEVLRQVIKGFSYKEIADNLQLSIHTVTSHIQHIYRKLSVRSRGEAVFEALQLGLVNV